jgi:hypothetical protein
MAFYYSLKSIPELAQLPAQMRWRAWFACVHKTFWHRQTWLALIAAEAPLFVFVGFLVWLEPSSYLPDLAESGHQWLPLALAGLGVLLLSAPGILIFSNIQSEMIRPYLRDHLAASRSHETKS